jgi:hypothetical protein
MVPVVVVNALTVMGLSYFALYNIQQLGFWIQDHVYGLCRCIPL